MPVGIGSEVAIRGLGWFPLWWQGPSFIARLSRQRLAWFIKPRRRQHPAMANARLGPNIKTPMAR